MGMLFALVGLLFGGAVPHKSQAIMSLCQAYDRWAVCAVAQPKPRFANRKWSGRSLLWLNPIFRVGRGVAIGRSTSPKRPPPVNDHLQSERGRLAGHVFACAFLCKPVQTERTPRRPGRPHSSTPPPRLPDAFHPQVLSPPPLLAPVANASALAQACCCPTRVGHHLVPPLPPPHGSQACRHRTSRRSSASGGRRGAAPAGTGVPSPTGSTSCGRTMKLMAGCGEG